MAMPESPLLSPSSWLDASRDTLARSIPDIVADYWWIIAIITVVILIVTAPRK